LKPDLVLLDGIEAARLMSGSDPTVPIILFTVLDLEGLETRARKAGICVVVSKAQGWNLLKSIEIAVTQSHSPIQ
jgi:hypothetical protein